MIIETSKYYLKLENITHIRLWDGKTTVHFLSKRRLILEEKDQQTFQIIFDNGQKSGRILEFANLLDVSININHVTHIDKTNATIHFVNEQEITLKNKKSKEILAKLLEPLVEGSGLPKPTLYTPN